MYHQTSSGIILPNSVQATKKPGQSFGDLRVYARNGRVLIERPTEDGTSMEEKNLSIDQARERFTIMCMQLKQLRKNSLEEKTVKEQIDPMTGFIERLESAIKTAEEQGPAEYDDMRRARARDASKSVFIPGNPSNDS